MAHFNTLYKNKAVEARKTSIGDCNYLKFMKYNNKSPLGSSVKLPQTDDQESPIKLQSITSERGYDDFIDRAESPMLRPSGFHSKNITLKLNSLDDFAGLQIDDEKDEDPDLDD